MKIHHRAKLPTAEVDAMRTLYDWLKTSGKRIGYGELSKAFLCGESTARDIITCRTRVYA